ncbi:MAG: hypothetical protein HW421_116 [Ignavibacteria bacterium]|nr:hypothetical protein [Ignavibacteria bacterium]
MIFTFENEEAMKTTKNLKLTAAITIFAIIALAFVYQITYAQPNGKCFTELKQNIADFARNTIIPDLSKWKAKLDGAMSAEDLSKLNDLRKQAATLNEKFAVEREQLRAKRQSGEEDTGQFKEVVQQHRDAMKKLGEQLKPLAEKYKSTLIEIGQVAKPVVEVWKEEVKNIFSDWKEKNQEELKAMKEKHGNGFGKMLKFRQFMKELDPEMNKKVAVARFMLWDGTDSFLRMLGN